MGTAGQLNAFSSFHVLFFMYCKDIQDMDLTNALQSLMALFVEHISTLSADITSVRKSKVTEWNGLHPKPDLFRLYSEVSAGKVE
mgnify:CR=1 FL=1